jgi:hypothetical protein
MPIKDYSNEINFDYLFDKLNIHDNDEKNWVKSEKVNFDYFYEFARKQPISSFIRVVELMCRSIPIFHNFFNIDYCFYNTNVKIGLCFFFPKAERFRIFVPYSANEDETRTIVAHEVGHLYCAVRFLISKFDPKDLLNNPGKYIKFLQAYSSAEGGKKYEIYENFANAIGIFILNERSLFYKNRLRTNERSLCKGFEQVTNDFRNLKSKVLTPTDITP